MIGKSTIHRFTARACASEELSDLESYVVMMYDDAQSPPCGVEIQKSLYADEQDREMGHDTCSVSLSDGRTYYGGIRQVQLDGNRLMIALDEHAAAALDEDGFDIVLDVPRTQIDGIVKGLSRIFEGDPKAPSVSIG
jgi:hypothetical protein